MSIIKLGNIPTPQEMLDSSLDDYYSNILRRSPNIDIHKKMILDTTYNYKYNYNPHINGFFYIHYVSGDWVDEFPSLKSDEYLFDETGSGSLFSRFSANAGTIGYDIDIPQLNMEYETYSSRNKNLNYATKLNLTSDFSIKFLEDIDLTVARYRSAHLQYIEALKKGYIASDIYNESGGDTSETFKNKYFDSLYVVLFDRFGTSIRGIIKLMGVTPINLPIKDIMGDRAQNALSMVTCNYKCHDLIYEFYEDTSKGDGQLYKELSASMDSSSSSTSSTSGGSSTSSTLSTLSTFSNTPSNINEANNATTLSSNEIKISPNTNTFNVLNTLNTLNTNNNPSIISNNTAVPLIRTKDILDPNDKQAITQLIGNKIKNKINTIYESPINIGSEVNVGDSGSGSSGGEQTSSDTITYNKPNTPTNNAVEKASEIYANNFKKTLENNLENYNKYPSFEQIDSIQFNDLITDTNDSIIENDDNDKEYFNKTLEIQNVDDLDELFLDSYAEFGYVENNKQQIIDKLKTENIVNQERLNNYINNENSLLPIELKNKLVENIEKMKNAYDIKTDEDTYKLSSKIIPDFKDDLSLNNKLSMELLDDSELGNEIGLYLQVT